MLNTCPTLNIVMLLSSHHARTLSTGLTFSNTFSLNFILRLSYFNLHHFILGVACSGFQPFLRLYSSLCMCQLLYPPTITLSPFGVALSSWWGTSDAVAEWLRALDWRPGGPGFESCCGNFVSELWQFRLPRFASVFRRRHYSRRSLLFGVYARGSKISHQCVLEMCNLS